MMKKVSVVLATYNEEDNLELCLKSVVDFADEIVVVDGGSTDGTVDIAKKYKARVFLTDNPPIFHINKQKALQEARGEWILQLDADELVTSKLADEVLKVISMSNFQLKEYQENLPNRKLFLRHQKLLNAKVQVDSRSSDYAGFFLPRLNYFLGKYLKYGGVYPDGVIRLVKRGRAHFPCKSVHEQIEVNGQVGWLNNDLLHRADLTFARYIYRNSKYIDLITKQMKDSKLKKDSAQFFNYLLIKPVWWFVLTTFIHKGILDGIQGVVFSFFSALRFPKAYLRYLRLK